MANEEKEIKIEDTEPEEVVFSFGARSEEKSPAKIEKHDDVQIVTASSDDEGIVFAETEAVPAVRRHSTGHVPKRRKNSFKIPALIASLALLCVAGGGIIFAAQYSSGTAASTTPVMTSADESVTSIASSKNKNNSEEPSTLPVVRVNEEDLKKIDTDNIVFGDNVTVSGVDLSGLTITEAYDAMQDRILQLRDSINITINCDGKSIELTEDDFDFDNDLPEILFQAYHYSRGELDVLTAETTQNGNKTDFKVTSVLNYESAAKATKKAAEKFDIQPVDAHVTAFEPEKTEKFKYADGSDGYLIDQNTVKEQIVEILKRSSKTGAFSTSTVRTPFKVTLADIKANTKLIASYHTTAANVWASNFNMQLAIKSANGYILKPGEIFSFNKMTGDTTNGALGYIPSTAIQNGEYIQSYGGGICQASTTIFLCALRADMEVIERHAHQFPSSYADRGLDATVDYGNLDMRFKNNKDFPIYIATYVYDYNGDGMNELMVEMYGQLSTEYDEIVSVGWVTSAGEKSYNARGAKVYFKDGKEIKREYLPVGSYDYHYDNYYYVSSMIPDDPEFGPKNVSPTGKAPTVYSPGGNGSNAPVAYGKAEEYLKEIHNPKPQTSKQTSEQTSKQSSAQTSGQTSGQTSSAASSEPVTEIQPI